MRALIAICIFLLSPIVATAAQNSVQWLGIFKSRDGFLFQGHLGHRPFSFDVPGNQISVAQQEGPEDSTARASIDGIFFSVMSVKKSDFPQTSPDTLISYRNAEQRYERQHLGRVELSDLDVCKDALFRHESWELRTLDIKAPPQVYLATKVGNYVLVIGSAYADAHDRDELLSKFSHVCKTFNPGRTRNNN